MFLVDSSGSIRDQGEGNYGLITQFIINVIEKLEIGENATRVGLVTFSDVALNEFYMNSHFDKASLRQAIAGIIIIIDFIFSCNLL